MIERAQHHPATLTRPLSPRLLDRPGGYRHFESAFFMGRGKTAFERCAEEVLHWQVKVRSGFDIVGTAMTPVATDRTTGLRTPIPVTVRAAGDLPGRLGRPEFSCL